MNDPELMLSPYVVVSWEAGEVMARSLLGERVMAASDAGMLMVMQAFSRPRSTADVASELFPLDPGDVKDITRELVEIGVLVASRPDCFWQAADLAFHETSTVLSGEVKKPPPNPIPAVRPRFGGPFCELPRADRAAAGSLGCVLRDRRSLRRFGAGAIVKETFAELLERAIGNGEPRPDGSVRRPYPSGGSTHSLEIYPVLTRGAVTGVPGGLHHYAAQDHVLELIADDDRVGSYFHQAARAMMGGPAADAPPIVLLVTSRFRRVCAGYNAIAYRLALLELGGLVQTLYLVAQSIGLGVCALGGVEGGDRLAELTGVDELEEPLMGAVALGPSS